jgi:hypothetical protein
VLAWNDVASISILQSTAPFQSSNNGNGIEAVRMIVFSSFGFFGSIHGDDLTTTERSSSHLK